MKPDISILIAARKNSKYLAKFLFGYKLRSLDFNNEVLVMLNKDDTWNKELVEVYQRQPFINIRFFYEDEGLGRGGLHVYFNKLLKKAKGDWVIYFCDDHFIIYDDWDIYFLNQISEWGLDPKGIHCLVPKFDNVGAMNQMLSRGYIKLMGGLGRHGNIDSYINEVNRELGPKYEKQIVHRFDVETFHDFTHDKPSPLDDINTKTELSDKGKALPKFNDPQVSQWIEKDASKIREVLDEL